MHFFNKKKKEKKTEGCVCACVYVYTHTGMHTHTYRCVSRKYTHEHVNFRAASRFLDLLFLAIYRNQRSKNIVTLVPNRKALIVIYYIVYTQLLAGRSD